MSEGAMKPEQKKFWGETLNKIHDRLPKMTRKQIEWRIFLVSFYQELDIYDHINIFQEICGELFYDHLYIEFADLRARNMRLEERVRALQMPLEEAQ